MTGQRSFRMGWFTARSGKKGWRTETGERLFGKPARNASKAYAAQGGNANRGVGRRLRDSDSDDGSVVSGQSGDEVVFHSDADPPPPDFVVFDEDAGVPVLPPVSTANILPDRRRPYYEEEEEHEVIVIDD